MDMETVLSRSSESSAKEVAEAPPPAEPTPDASPATDPAPSEPAAEPAKPEGGEGGGKKGAENPAPSEGKPSPNPGAAATAAAAAAAAGVPYNPNFKYKVADQEKEIPEKFRALVTDEASEKELREIFEKSDGLPIVKGRLGELQTKHKDLSTKFETLNTALSELGEMARKGDFSTFFETIQIPRERIYEWALREAEISQLPPEERQRVEEARAAQKTAEIAERNRMSAEQMAMEAAVETRRLQMQLTLSQPEVADFAKRFNDVFGNPKAFELEIVKAGRQMWDTEKKDMGPSELAQMIMNHYGKFLPASASSGNPPAAAGASVQPPATGGNPNAPQVKPNQPAPTIPNLQGGTTSPTKAVPKTLADLRKLANEATGRMAMSAHRP